MTQISTEDAGTHIIGFILMKIAEFISNIF